VIFIAALLAQKVANQLQSTDFGQGFFTKSHKKVEFIFLCIFSRFKLDELSKQAADNVNDRLLDFKNGI
jgi:hypothetical protein